MSDDEQQFEREEEEEREDSPVREASPPPAQPPQLDADGKSEAERMMEERKKKDDAKQVAELEEYYEMRKEEKERIDNEIAELKEKRAQRLQEREEEERRLAEQRAQQDEQRRAEEAERQRKKQEEADKRNADREAKRIEAEERSKNMGKKNFVINRKGGQSDPSEDSNGPVKEEKTKEQLEAERKSVLEQRTTSLGDPNSMSEEQLKEKARELHRELHRLESEIYDQEQTFKQRQYEMNELAERARSMNKGKGKKNISSEVDPLADIYSGIPPKILICSKYERHTDRRTYVERKDVFGGPIYGEEAARILPKWERGEDDEAPAEAKAEEE